MTSKTFTSGTVVDSPWLNDVNTSTYTTVPAITTKLSPVTSISTFSGTVLPSADAPTFRTAIAAAASGTNGDITSMTTLSSINGGQLAGLRNALINGDFRITQRGSSIATTSDANPTPGYTADRWYVYHNQAIGSAGTCTFPAGPTNVTGLPYGNILTITSATQTIVSHVSQRIESANCKYMAGQTVTLSYWVYQNTGGNVSFTPKLGYPASTDTFTLANITDIASTGAVTIPSGTWTKVTRVFSVPTAAITGLVVDLGNISMVGGNLISFAAAQLEVSSVATQFEQRPYGLELALCQRYLPAFNAKSTSDLICNAYAFSSTTVVCVYPFSIQPRVPPTGVTTQFQFSSTSSFVGSAIAFGTGSLNVGSVNLTVAGATAGQGGSLQAINSAAQILWTGCEL